MGNNMHARMPKHFVLEERLERYGRAIEADPAHWRGQWARACWPLFSPTRTAAQRRAAYRAVFLDLGCGKGAFLVDSAQRNPSVLFIGMDAEPVCIAYAAQRVCESGVRNAVAVPGTADKLGTYFASGELAGITLNFPTPHPKAHYAQERLTSVAHLLAYRNLLAPGGAVTLRTDSLPLWRFSLETFRDAGYRMRWVSANVRAEHPELPETEYEVRLRARGATVYGICAEPAPLAEDAAQAALAAHEKPRSLMDYLPEDVFSLDYVPYGMERAVENLRNRRLKQPDKPSTAPNSHSRCRR